MIHFRLFALGRCTKWRNSLKLLRNLHFFFLRNIICSLASRTVPNPPGIGNLFYLTINTTIFLFSIRNTSISHKVTNPTCSLAILASPAGFFREQYSFLIYHLPTFPHLSILHAGRKVSVKHSKSAVGVGRSNPRIPLLRMGEGTEEEFLSPQERCGTCLLLRSRKGFAGQRLAFQGVLFTHSPSMVPWLVI